jgi:hypothetical protein
LAFGISGNTAASIAMTASRFSLRTCASAHRYPLIDHLDESILAKSFRGELVPQDPDDEPASIVVERIKTERSAAQPRRGRKS